MDLKTDDSRVAAISADGKGRRESAWMRVRSAFRHSTAENQVIYYNTKSLLLLPVVVILFVGVSHALYLCGLTFAETVINVQDLSSWSILGWGVGDDMPGWLLLMVVTFILGLRRSKAAGLAAWLLSLSFPLAEAILYRRLPILLVLEAGGVQLVGSLMGCVAWAAGWWVSGRIKGVTRGNRANASRSTTRVVLTILLLSFSAYGWWGLSVNIFQVARPDRSPDLDSLEVLAVPENAKNVSRLVAPDKSIHVSYELAQEYPAMQTIEHISTRLVRFGWEPLRNDWLNPGITSSHIRGWTEHVDATETSPSRRLTWRGQWKDRIGNVVEYTFMYDIPPKGRQSLDLMRVHGTWYPGD